MTSLVLLFASLASSLTLNSTHPLPDDLSEDTNTIESLTPEQAQRLRDGFQDTFLSLDRLRELDADTAAVLAGMKVQYLSLDGLTTIDAEAATALANIAGSLYVSEELECGFCDGNPLTADTVAAWVALTRGDLAGVTDLDSSDSLAVAKALAACKGPLRMPDLRKISPNTLTALLGKQDIEIPPVETLDLIAEPDGSPPEDFVIPEWLAEQNRERR